MKKNVLFFVTFVVLGFFLRFHQYFLFPIGGETSDENAWTLLGASLIQERVPASWSYFSAYKGYEYKMGVYDAPIVRPVFDHPPLFSFLPGLFHSLKSEWSAYPSMKVIRLPMVVLGALNVGLFWLVAQRFFKESKWAVVATLLFMTIPEIVFGSRLVVAENLVVTWNLLAILGLLFSKEKWSLPLLVVISFSAVLTKVSGGVIPLSLVILGMAQKEKKWVQAGLIGGGLGVLAFIFYGFIYNWELFVEVFSAQSNRLLGFATLQNRFFLHPTLVKHIFFDGWKILGLFSVFFLFSEKERKHTFIQVFTLMNLLFVFLTVGESTFHGWYDYVLWPMLVLAITVLFQKIEENKSFLLAGFMWLLVLPVFRLVMRFTQLELSSVSLRLLMVAGFIPFFLESFSLPRLRKIVLPLLFFLVLSANIVVIFSLTQEAYWVQSSFFEQI